MWPGGNLTHKDLHILLKKITNYHCMGIDKKRIAFEYLLTLLLNWAKELIPVVPEYSFTRLKALKLLFFTAAVKNEQGGDLLDIFDNFYALPNGPVESDIYNCITADQLTYYSFNDFSFGLKQNYDEKDLNEELKSRIKLAVEALRGKNERIVAYKADQLVDLSHIWLSWQKSISMAKAFGKGSYRMNLSEIRSNPQIFTI